MCDHQPHLKERRNWSQISNSILITVKNDYFINGALFFRRILCVSTSNGYQHVYDFKGNYSSYLYLPIHLSVFQYTIQCCTQQNQSSTGNYCDFRCMDYFQWRKQQTEKLVGTFVVYYCRLKSKKEKNRSKLTGILLFP